jgi:hypothetical protein
MINAGRFPGLEVEPRAFGYEPKAARLTIKDLDGLNLDLFGNCLVEPEYCGNLMQTGEN